MILRTPYEARTSHDDNYYCHGPSPIGGYFTYYGGTMYPGSRFETFEEATKIALLLNVAYSAGYAEAQRAMRITLGVEDA